MGAPIGSRNNPKGRPPKNRALTTLLEQAGSATVATPDDRRVSAKRLLATMLWEGATNGYVTLPDGRRLPLAMDEWLGLVRFIYQHVDGPPRPEMDVGGEVILRVVHESKGTDDPAA